MHCGSAPPPLLPLFLFLPVDTLTPNCSCDTFIPFSNVGRRQDDPQYVNSPTTASRGKMPPSLREGMKHFVRVRSRELKEGKTLNFRLKEAIIPWQSVVHFSVCRHFFFLISRRFSTYRLDEHGGGFLQAPLLKLLLLTH